MENEPLNPELTPEEMTPEELMSAVPDDLSPEMLLMETRAQSARVEAHRKHCVDDCLTRMGFRPVSITFIEPYRCFVCVSPYDDLYVFRIWHAGIDMNPTWHDGHTRINLLGGHNPLRWEVLDYYRDKHNAFSPGRLAPIRSKPRTNRGTTKAKRIMEKEVRFSG